MRVGGRKKSPGGAFGGLAGDFFLLFLKNGDGRLEPFDFFEYEEGGA